MTQERAPDTGATHDEKPLTDHEIERAALVARNAGRAVVRSAPSPGRAPGAILSAQSSRELQEELAAWRTAESLGAAGGDGYYIGVGQLPE